jgi:hypothetical protein
LRLLLKAALRLPGLIPKLRPLYCRVPKQCFSRTPWHTYAHPPVSVYGTGTVRLALEVFLGTPFSSLARLAPGSRSRRGLCDTDFPISHPSAPKGSFRDPQKMQEYVTPLKPYGSAGIFTCCPSVTPFGLALGPANPGTIRVALETLGLRWTGFSPVFLLLMPTFSLRNAPRWLTPFASAQMRMLPYRSSLPKKTRIPRLR